MSKKKYSASGSDSRYLVGLVLPLSQEGRCRESRIFLENPFQKLSVSLLVNSGALISVRVEKLSDGELEEIK